MGTGPGRQVVESAEFPGVPESAGEARRWLRKLLISHPRAYTAELLLSEVVTNALVHTESTVIEVTLAASEGGAIRVEVIDEGAVTLPCVCRHLADEPGESGRGMLIVRSQASRWGFTEEEYGCMVWFGLD